MTHWSNIPIQTLQVLLSILVPFAEESILQHLSQKTMVNQCALTVGATEITEDYTAMISPFSNTTLNLLSLNIQR